VTIEQRIERIERIERQNRRLKRAVIGMAVAGLSVLVMGQTLPPKVHDVVKAREFRVVSGLGRTNVKIGTNRNCKRESIGLGCGGNILVYGKQYRGKMMPGRRYFTDPRHKIYQDIVTEISEDKFGNGFITTYSNKFRKVRIGTDGSGTGSITTYGSRFKKIVTIGGSKSGKGKDSARKPLIGITSDQNGEGRVTQFNREGNVTAVWPPMR